MVCLQSQCYEYKIHFVFVVGIMSSNMQVKSAYCLSSKIDFATHAIFLLGNVILSLVFPKVMGQIIIIKMMKLICPIHLHLRLKLISTFH